MAFLSPIWLFALAAIGIPVLIHLWNIRPGKTLKVGSIALFNESSPKSSRSFKFQDIFLLLLRCLILLLIAFLLAGPYLHRHLANRKSKGWVVIPEDKLKQTYGHFQHEIDSLIKTGYEFHYFNTGFKKSLLAEELKRSGDSIARKESLNYWALIGELNRQISPQIPVALFTDNTIEHFKGHKPATDLKLKWQTYTPDDSAAVHIAGAWLTANGHIRIVQRRSTPRGINYNYQTIKNEGADEYDVDVSSGIPVVGLKTNPSEKISVDTSIKRIAIYADKNETDAAYLRSALDAISQFTQQKTVIKWYADARNIPAGQDWLFWLSDKPVWANQAKNIFQYQAGKVTGVNSSLTNKIISSQTAIPVYQVIKSIPAGEVLWSDGLGNPILSVVKGKINSYHFYSRFNPIWSDLVWCDEYPKWLMGLTNNLKIKQTRDTRAISPEQLQPVPVNAKEPSATIVTESYPLVNYLWVALLVVFVIERLLATRNPKIITNG